MKVTVFGAAGRTGQDLVQQALDRGLDVIAHARDTRKIVVDSPRLVKIAGELSDRDTIKTAIEGSDCVLSALGPIGQPSDEELSDGIATILSVMEQCGVTRLVALSTTSAQDVQDRDSFRAKLRRAMVKKGRPTSYNQIVEYSQLIRASASDWTLVRIAAVLTSTPVSRQVSVGYLGKERFHSRLSRSDLAWFMLEQLDTAEHSRKAPAISN